MVTKEGGLEQSPTFHRGRQNQGAREGTPIWGRGGGSQAAEASTLSKLQVGRARRVGNHVVTVHT